MDLHRRKDLKSQSALPPIPDHLDDIAFLLDFDGTLVDIAPTPDRVTVEADLVTTLLALRVQSGEALAVITGRTIQEIDHFLPDIPFAVSGEHGMTLRASPKAVVEVATHDSLPPQWLTQSQEFAKQAPGVTIERKKNGLVLHYREAPELGLSIQKFLGQLVTSQSGYVVQPAKMAFEIRSSTYDKGEAVKAIMMRPPFRNKIPLFVGDDITDLDGIRAAQTLGGMGYLIPNDIPSSAAFRAWLKRCVKVAR